MQNRRSELKIAPKATAIVIKVWEARPKKFDIVRIEALSKVRILRNWKNLSNLA